MQTQTKTTDSALTDIVQLSNRVGSDERLVQPGGGNTSIKVHDSSGGNENGPLLLVKGSGTDLRSINAAGFTQLTMPKLSALRDVDDMSDADMMQFMTTCMINPNDPFPSVETPLHSILPYNVIVHTHDIATMSLTNLNDSAAERLVNDLFEQQIVYMPYARPGFPLARLASQVADEIPADAIGMTLAHHGLVVWGDNAAECQKHLDQVIGKIDKYIEAKRGAPKPPSNIRPPLADDKRRQSAELLLPVIRGAMALEDKVVLHLDDSRATRDSIDDPALIEMTRRGVATPEHVLRAGKAPVWLILDFDATDEELVSTAREQIQAAKAEYDAYHARQAQNDEQPLADWAKVFLIPGLGVVTAFKDKKSARVANTCYAATIESIKNAEALGGFRFLPEDQVFEFEHWPLERRKVDEAILRERKEKLLPRHVALIIGGTGGIGHAAAERFVEEGANVVIADLDPEAASRAAENISKKFPTRAIGVGCDVTNTTSIEDAVRQTVLEYGGLDCLFYTAGAAPKFARLVDIEPTDLQRQMDIHYLGGVLAMRTAARVMARQGTGGSIILSVSKAAVSAGKEALAYGASKAALLQAMRVAAVELGEHGIRVNAVNADQIDTPLFRKFVAERAASRGVSEEEQLDNYRKRNAMGVSLIPPINVAELAVLLASSRFRYTTGDVITIDGGLPEAFPR